MADTKRVDIGGQAVLEGVMMRSPDAVAISVRRPNGDIVVSRKDYHPVSEKHPILGKPVIRGAVSFVMMLKLGMETLEESSRMLGTPQEEPSKFEKWLAAKLGKSIDKVVMGVALVLALALSVGLFVLLPNLPTEPLRNAGWSPVAINLICGLIRIIILLGYMGLCGLIPDMKRTFMYHGSEHKTVFCHEHNLPLTAQNAQQFSTLHPRCGTSFLLITFVLSILLFSVIDYLLLPLGIDVQGNYFLKILVRLLFLLPVTGVSFEVLKGLAHNDSKVCRILRGPGLALQHLTTRQPTDDMCDVAICSINAALHGLPEGEPTEEGWVIIPKDAQA